MTILAGLSPSGTLIVRAGEPKVLNVALTEADGTTAQNLDGRSFALIIRRSARVEPLFTLAAELSDDSLYVSVMMAADTATAVFDAGSSLALSYDIVELSGGASISRFSERVQVLPGPELPSDTVPVWVMLPYTEAMIRPDALVISEKGARGDPRMLGYPDTPDGLPVSSAQQEEFDELAARIDALAYPGLAIPSFSIAPSVAEVGAAVVAPVATVTRTGASPTAQTLTWPGDSVPLGSADLTKTLAGKSFTATTTLKWTATDADAPGGPVTAEKTATLTFAQKGHAGTINKPGGITSAEVNAMAQSWFATSVGRTLNFVTASPGFVWYSQPASQADPSAFKIGGLSITPSKTTRTDHVTATGQTVPYKDFLLSSSLPAGTAINLEVIA